MKEGAQVDIPYSRWNAAIPFRRSRRQYDSQPLDPGELERLREVCRDFRPFPGARADVLTESPDRILRGAVGPYGKVKGAPALIAFTGTMDDPHVQEKLGYTGEGIILEVTAMGLGTCWVGGFFRPKVAASVVGIARNEKVLAVTPVGQAVERPTREEVLMTGFGLNHRRKPLRQMVTGLDREIWPRWVETALEAARIAPSAVNRQPWRFHVEPDCITVSVDSPRINLGISKRLDCGIAMLHIEVAALASGVGGEWELLEAPHVARFNVGSC
jgi:nitroreductase